MLILRPYVLVAGVLAGCGFQVAGGPTGDGGIDPDDAQADAATDALLPCYGAPDGLVRICLTTPAPPTFEVGAARAIDTDASSSCVAVTGTGAAGSCVIAAQTIRIAQALRATGTRPLLLVGDTIEITASGTIDVASHQAGSTGAGANSPACGSGGVAGVEGGGPGGSFTGRGGGGGSTSGGASAAVAPEPTTPRGGCPGGKGYLDGAGGAGGGAVYLIAAGSITVAGSINASGAGGSGGPVSDNAGGGGGGSGGMIVLDAPAVAITGAVFANGAGGGEGADSASGRPGQDPLDATTLPKGGIGGNTNGGEGGDGTVGSTRTGESGAAPYGLGLAGGGGGGGGAGFIRIYGVRSGTGSISPPSS